MAMKKATRVIGYVLIVLLLLIGAAMMAVQSPWVQTALGKAVIRQLQDRIDGDITFERIQVKPFDAIVIKDFAIVDQAPYQVGEHAPVDTFARAGYITAQFSIRGLFFNEGLHVSRATVTDGALYLVTEPGTTNLARIFRIVPSDKEPQEPGRIFDANRVEVNNFHFRLVNHVQQARRTPEHPGPGATGGIDWADLDLTADVKVHSLKFHGGILSGVADQVRVREKSGAAFDHISGSAAVGQGRAAVEDLVIRDGRSDIRMSHFTMTYPRGRFGDFLRSVRMDADILPSTVDMGSIAWFAPVLMGNPFHAAVQGHVEGPVSDLDVTTLTFDDHASGVAGHVRCRLTGLPDAAAMVLDCGADGVTFDAAGLGAFIGEWARGDGPDLGRFAPGETFTLDAAGHGTLDDFHIDADVTGENGDGSLTAALALRNVIDRQEPLSIGGRLRTDRFDLGRLLGTDRLGPLSMASVLTLSLPKEGPAVRVDTLDIQRLRALGYDYSGLSLTGRYRSDAFQLDLESRDPGLDLSLHGRLAEGRYRLDADCRLADLQVLQLDHRGTSRLAFHADADLGTDLSGSARITGLTVEGADGPKRIGDLTLRSDRDAHRLRLASAFLDGTYEGDHPIQDLAGDLQRLTLRQEVPALYDIAPAWDHGTYRLALDFHDSRDLLSYVLPGLYIADSTHLRLAVSPEGRFDGSLVSPRLALRDRYLRGLSLRTANADSVLRLDAAVAEARLGRMLLRDNRLEASADDDRVGLSYRFRNDDDNRGTLRLAGDILPGPAVRATLLPSEIRYGGDTWSLLSSDLRWSPGEVSVSRFIGYCDDQSITLDGALSDTLEMHLQRFDLSLFNDFLQHDFRLEGTATGHASMTAPAGLLLDLTCDSVRVAGQRAGTLRLRSTWDSEDEAFDIDISEMLDGTRPLSVGGSVTPSTRAIDLTAGFDGFDVGLIAPALRSVFTDMQGGIRGDVHISGTFDAPELSSRDTRFEDTRLTIGYTRVPYTLNGPFRVDDTGLHFDQVTITDRHGGQGDLHGGLLYDRLHDIRLEIGADLREIEALATTFADNPVFYGNASATGTVGITGPLDDIALNINVSTAGAGEIHIPLGGAGARTTDLLTFTEDSTRTWVDPYEQMLRTFSADKKLRNNFSVNLKVSATPAVQTFVEIGGNTLNGRGSGTIGIEAGNDIFNIGGNYGLIDGNFHLSLLGITSKDFTLEDGSSIRFNGDIMDSDLDIQGTYRTKTSLSRLLSDTTSVTTRRIVECGITLTDKLRNPQLKFSIDIPDLDPTTQARVESALNTDDKVQKQFLSLLVSGSLLPTEESGIVNNSNVMVSSVTEIMASQLNYIFQRLDIPLDLGLTYQSTNRGYDIFDVAVSTQLFNNRVVVNGTIGNKNYVRTNTSEVVGDIDIEVKLNKPGTLRMSLFSHSADEYTNYLDNSQRNGAGLSYQREFNHLGQFLRELFTPRRRRQSDDPVTPRTTLRIDADGQVLHDDE